MRECKEKIAPIGCKQGVEDHHSHYLELCKEISDPLMLSMLNYRALDEEEGNSVIEVSTDLIKDIGKDMWFLSMMTARAIEVKVLELKNPANLIVKTQDLDKIILSLEAEMSATESQSSQKRKESEGICKERTGKKVRFSNDLQVRLFFEDDHQDSLP